MARLVRVSLGTHDLNKGQSSFITNSQSKPEPMPAPPPVMQNNPSPRPDDKEGISTEGGSAAQSASTEVAEATTLTATKTSADTTPATNTAIEETTLFSTENVEGTPPGVYITVSEGDVNLVTEDGVINIGVGETGYIEAEITTAGQITTSEPVRLDETVVFESVDPYPSPDTFDPTQAEQGIFSLLADTTSIDANILDTGFACVIQ